MTNATEEQTATEGTQAPKYLGWSFKDLWDNYHSLHEISDDGTVNKPKARDKRVKKNKKNLDEMVTSELGISDEQDNLFGKDDAEQRAVKAIAKIVHEGYKAKYGREEDVEEPNEDMIRTFINEVFQGQPISYEDILKEILNADDLSADSLHQNTPYFHRLVEYVADIKEEEGREVRSIQRELQKHEHWNNLRGKVGDVTGSEFNESATPTDLFREYNMHLQRRQIEVNAKLEKTYKAKKAKNEYNAATNPSNN